VFDSARLESAGPIRQDNRADLHDDGPMRLLIVLANVAAVIGLAVPAHADPPPPPPDPASDSTFLDSLNKAGMVYRSGPDAIAAGRMACDMMNAGQPETDVINKLAALNPGLNNGGAMKFAALASSAYCPDFLTKSSQKNNSLFPGLGGR
jgi:hypothetical protein